MRLMLMVQRTTEQIFAAVLCVVVGSSVASAASLPSFPGAEGFGAVSVGGRGGRVIKVTNLNASGPGSLQAACAEPGPRIVVFTVGGVIRGDVAIAHSNITIAGQSAPLPGITIVGRLLARPIKEERLHDIIVRHLRIRPSPTTGVDGDAIQLPMTDRIMLDHLSLAWANDEMIDIIYSSEVSVQWSTIEESDDSGHAKGSGHNFAILSAYPGSGKVSIHHNLFAHHSRRLPSVSPQVEASPADFRNNVIYNFKDGLSHEGHRPRAPINIVANYYKRGPNAKIIYPFNFDDAGQYYVSDNYFEDLGIIGDPRAGGISLPSWIRSGYSGTLLSKPASVSPVRTGTAQEAYSEVLSVAGAWPRDRTTLRTIGEVRAGNGKWGRNAPAVTEDRWLLEGLPHSVIEVDRDNDGMADAWERTNGLDSTNPQDNLRRMPSGYSAIDEYLNHRASELLFKGRRQIR